MNQYYQQSIGMLLCLVASSCFGIQSVNAEDTHRLNQQLTQAANLQAQLPFSQQLQLRNVQVGTEGLVLSINGNPQISTTRVANPDRLILDLQATEVPARLHNSTVVVNRYGIKQIRVAQFQKSPAIARLVLDLSSPTSTNWQGSFDASRGLLLLKPVGAQSDSPVSTLPPNIPIPTNNQPTTIDGLSFNGYGQLVIQASRAINYRSTSNSGSNTYSFTIPATRISSQLRRPILGANSPIEQIRLNQVGDAVVVSVKTIAGWQLREVPRTNAQQVALQLFSASQTSSSLPTNPRSPNLPTYSNNNGRGIVVIDPGHGGPDVGATRNGIYEKDIVLSISGVLGKMLQQMGYSVVYTRTEDIDLDLEPRVQIAETAKADVFVSVHVNSLEASSSQVNGVETYYAPGASLGKNLADLVHEQILASTGANDRGVRSARFYVIRNTSMPAILVETGYITNPSEASKLISSSYQERLAEAIAKGVDRFLKSYQR